MSTPATKKEGNSVYHYCYNKIQIIQVPEMFFYHLSVLSYIVIFTPTDRIILKQKVF